jgi:hypothetical protein
LAVIIARVIRDDYNWLYWAWVARLLNKTDGDAPPGSSMMAAVEAVAGRLRNPPSQAANDMSAAMFILVFVWLWNCANYRAKLVNPVAVLREKARSEIFEAAPANPAWILALQLIAARISQCQFNHLPTDH